MADDEDENYVEYYINILIDWINKSFCLKKWNTILNIEELSLLVRTLISNVISLLKTLTGLCEIHHKYFTMFNNKSLIAKDNVISASKIINLYTRPFASKCISLNIAKRCFKELKSGALINDHYKYVNSKYKSLLFEYIKNKGINLNNVHILNDNLYEYELDLANFISNYWMKKGQAAAKFGTYHHQLLESICKNYNEKKFTDIKQNISKIDKSVLSGINNFLQSFIFNNKWTILQNELSISSKKYNIVGTIDFIYLKESVLEQLNRHFKKKLNSTTTNNNNDDDGNRDSILELHIGIGDWKFIKDKDDHKNSNKCKYELSNYLDTKKFRYTIQLNIYKQILDEMFNMLFKSNLQVKLTVSHLSLICFDYENNKYTIEELEILPQSIIQSIMLRAHYTTLNSNNTHDNNETLSGDHIINNHELCTCPKSLEDHLSMVLSKISI
ncbi:MAG: PD-(D/E)XK nuclease family protein [Cotesia congregata filamentous virus 2]